MSRGPDLLGYHRRPATTPRRVKAAWRGALALGLLAALLAGLPSSTISLAQTTGPWEETRFTTGCTPGPYSTFQYPDPPVPPVRPPRDQFETAGLTVDLQPDPEARPLLGMGFNVEHTLWSCPIFRPVFEREILEAFQPAIARVDTGVLPAAPAELSADELNRAVYQSVLSSVPYRDSWRFLRLLNQENVRIVLGVWGGPAQFTDNGDRLGTLLPEHYDDYVEYVVSVVDYLVLQQDVHPWAITIANEPDGGDGNHIPPEGLAYIAHELALRLEPYDVKIYGPDTANAQAALEYLPWLLSDPVVASHMAFVGFHQYYGDPQVGDVATYVHTSHPELPVIITEYTSFLYGLLDDGQETTDPTAFMLDITDTLLAHYRYGADAALYWDVADSLQAGHDSITKWGLLRGPADNFARRPWYYSFSQILPYLQPGSRVLNAESRGDDDVSTLAVRTADGGLAIFLVNLGQADVGYAIDLEGDTSAMRGLAAYRTDHDLQAAYVGRVRLRDGQGQLSLPGRSITTLTAQ